MMTAQRTQILTPKSAAQWLGLAESTLAKMRLSGAGPTYVKLGPRRVGYLEDDLTTWVSAQRFSSTSQY
jgi:predicted DNA-binding transcriptional regulator AlpA